MTPASPPSADSREAGLPPALLAELDRLASVDRLLVALDFDGTVAPIVDEPSAARALPEAHAALLALAAMPRTTVALVSGRSLASLAEVAKVPDSVPLVGSHGLEVRLGDLADRDDTGALAAGQPAATDSGELDALRAIVAPLVEAVEGAWIELKPAGLAVHTRQVDDASAGRLTESVRAAALAHNPRLTVRRGLDVLEFSLRDATKADGLEALREAARSDAVLFAGDDVTDEDALAALRPDDVGIKVGTAETVAAHRLPDAASMAEALVALAARRLAAATVE